MLQSVLLHATLANVAAGIFFVMVVPSDASPRIGRLDASTSISEMLDKGRPEQILPSDATWPPYPTCSPTGLLLRQAACAAPPLAVGGWPALHGGGHSLPAPPRTALATASPGRPRGRRSATGGAVASGGAEASSTGLQLATAAAMTQA